MPKPPLDPPPAPIIQTGPSLAETDHSTEPSYPLNPSARAKEESPETAPLSSIQESPAESCKFHDVALDRPFVAQIQERRAYSLERRLSQFDLPPIGSAGDV